MAKTPTPKKSSLRAAYANARKADPRPITGKEKPAELLAHAFSAYVGRQERTAFELMQQSVQQDASIFLTLSGAMTPAGLHQSCLIPLVEKGIISAITTTGANLYHDAHRIIGHGIREVNPNAGDLQYRLARIIRIYDLGFWEEALLDTDRLFSAILRQPEFQKKMTTPEFHYLLGKAIHGIEKQLGVKQPSLLSTCYKHGVPIWVGAVQDGSIFLNVVKLKRLLGDEFKFELDINDDVYSMAAMQHYCRHNGSGKLAIWILGGGVPKNYTLQGEPLLDQILNVPTSGFDIDVQFCVDPVDNGALSSCPAGEGHTWGKVSVEAVETGSMYVHCDVTAVFPWLTHALFSEPKNKRKPMRLMDKMGDAVKFLDADVKKRSKSLMKTLDWSVEEAEPSSKKDAKAHDTFVR
ncbi:deoxyhypusine synthase family protein [Corallococcus carmarthensis]|uniref:deoxyhypusine synthase family protein n=1 Tax=Corallococcus carmarthensis TaxID=2316728 RepID=UPI00148D5CE0|nr:deoxyhypusine synthase family protein [Corallococcus carmarthensis]NOK18480.1 deoxyhypusine synthase [Corallococcus carmarthensis]